MNSTGRRVLDFFLVCFSHWEQQGDASATDPDYWQQGPFFLFRSSVLVTSISGFTLGASVFGSLLAVIRGKKLKQGQRNKATKKGTYQSPQTPH